MHDRFSLPQITSAFVTFATFVTPRRCLLAAAFLFLLMIAVGSIPGQAEAVNAAVGDKLMHFLAYAALTVLVFGGLPGDPFTSAIRTLLVIALMGATDEAIQALLPYRHANWSDWTIDLLAASSSVAVMLVLQPFQFITRMAHATCEPASQTESAARREQAD